MLPGVSPSHGIPSLATLPSANRAPGDVDKCHLGEAMDRPDVPSYGAAEWDDDEMRLELIHPVGIAPTRCSVQCTRQTTYSNQGHLLSAGSQTGAANVRVALGTDP